MKKIICGAVAILIAVIVIYNVTMFAVIPAFLPQVGDVSVIFNESMYDYPSFVCNQPAGFGGAYYYPLIAVDVDDECEYMLVKESLFGYTIDDTEFLKRHKNSLVVYNPGNYYGTTHSFRYELYRDGELIDEVACEYFETQSFDMIMWIGTDLGKILILIFSAVIIIYVFKIKKKEHGQSDV